MSNQNRRDVANDLRRVISDFQDNYYQYSHNMHEYNKIITQYMEMTTQLESVNRLNTPLSRVGTPPILRTPRYNSNRAYNRFESELFNYIFSPSLSTSSIFNDETIGLTQQEINGGTTLTRYDMSMNEQRCPISHIDFVTGDEICKINHCGHFFKKDSILRWFENNTVCPVCRHDLRSLDTTDPSGAQTYTFDVPLYLNLQNSNRRNF